MTAGAIIALSRRPSAPPRRSAEATCSPRAGVGVVAGREQSLRVVSVATADGVPEPHLVPPRVAGAGAARNWNALKQARSKTAAFVELSKPYRVQTEEQKLRRRFGTNIGPNAQSPRWDVQNIYRQLFFPYSQSIAVAGDTSGDQLSDGVMGHWSTLVNAVGQEDRDRAQVVDKLKRRFKSATVWMAKVRRLSLHHQSPWQRCSAHHCNTHVSTRAQRGVSWNELFAQYDLDGNGVLDMDEFLQAVRFDGNVKEDQISDREVDELFKHIDEDNSGGISQAEFSAFTSKTTRKRPRLPLSGKMKSSSKRLLTALEKEVLAIKEAERSEGVPFIAEYIATERIPLRQTCKIDSKIVGFLNVNEVVAVTQVWKGNEMKCHRLRLNAKPLSGWASQRGRAKSGKISILLSRLSRDEWTSIAFHETSVAQRVSTLRCIHNVMDRPEVKHERLLREKRMGPGNQISAHISDAWVSDLLELGSKGPEESLEEAGAEDPKAVAVGFLSKCTTDHELAELLDLLERTQRSEWRRVGRAWEVSSLEKRKQVAAAAKKSLERREQELASSAMPPAATRQFASIDRALLIHKKVESKRQPTPVAPTEQHSIRRNHPTYLEGKVDSASSQNWDTRFEAIGVNTESVQDNTGTSTDAISQPPALSPATSLGTSARADRISCARQQPDVPSIELHAAPSDDAEILNDNLSARPEETAGGVVVAELTPLGVSTGSCASVLWRAPRPTALVHSARRHEPPPRSTHSQGVWDSSRSISL